MSTFLDLLNRAELYIPIDEPLILKAVKTVTTINKNNGNKNGFSLVSVIFLVMGSVN
jgi:hypothetical protein